MRGPKASVFYFIFLWVYDVVALLDAAVQMVDARLEALDNLANATDLVEFDLEFVDFAENGAEAGDFGIGHLDRVTRAVVLHLGRSLRLLRELHWAKLAGASAGGWSGEGKSKPTTRCRRAAKARAEGNSTATLTYCHRC